MTLKRLAAVCSLVCAAQMAGGGENLIFNSSFELGDKGWIGGRGCLASEAGEYKYSGPVISADTKEAKFGKSSLRADNRNADQIGVGSHDVNVFEGKKYTLSVWAKSDSSGCPVIIRAQRRGFVNNEILMNFSKSCISANLTADWKRYSYSFVSQKGTSAYYITLEAGQSVNMPEYNDLLNNETVYSFPAQIWLDGIQFEEGELTDYKPANAVEAAVYAPEIIAGAEKVSGQLSVISYGRGIKDFPLTLTLCDSFFHKSIADQKFLFNLKEGEAEKKDFNFALSRFGAFTVSTSLQPEPADNEWRPETGRPDAPPVTKRSMSDLAYQSEAFFVRVWEPKKWSGKGFRIGAQRGINNLSDIHYGKVKNGAKAFRNDIAESPDSAAEKARLAGCLIWREWGGDDCLGNWRTAEPQEGKFMWSRWDKSVDALRKRGIDIMVCLLGDINSKKYRPDWALSRSIPFAFEDPEVESHERVYHGKYFEASVPQPEDMKRFISALVSHYKGKVKYYEFLNEANYISAGLYMKYLPDAYKAIKKADPSAVVAGMSGTEDRGADAEGFISSCLKLGAGKYCDIITYHPYGARADDSPVSSIKMTRIVKNALAKQGAKHPLWNGELFYLDAKTQPSHVKYHNDWTADAIPRRFIVDMGEGLQASCPLDFKQFGQRSGQTFIRTHISKQGVRHPPISRRTARRAITLTARSLSKHSIFPAA